MYTGSGGRPCEAVRCFPGDWKQHQKRGGIGMKNNPARKCAGRAHSFAKSGIRLDKGIKIVYDFFNM